RTVRPAAAGPATGPRRPSPFPGLAVAERRPAEPAGPRRSTSRAVRRPRAGSQRPEAFAFAWGRLLNHETVGQRVAPARPALTWQNSLHLFKVARLPGAVERRSLRPVDAKVREPALAGDRLNPTALLAGWGLRAEVKVRGLRVSGVLQLEH